MGFESVRGYVHLASGLTEATKARATGAAQGLLSLPAAGISTGSKVAVSAGALAEEMLSVATTNHSSLTALVRSEVEVAVTRLGLVSAEKLEEAQAEATRLRTEVARLRAASSMAGPASNTRAAKKPDSATHTDSGAPLMNGTAKTTSNGAAKTTAIIGSARKATKGTKATKATKVRSPDKANSARSARKASTGRPAKAATTASKPASSRRSAVSTRAKPAGT